MATTTNFPTSGSFTTLSPGTMAGKVVFTGMGGGGGGGMGSGQYGSGTITWPPAAPKIVRRMSPWQKAMHDAMRYVPSLVKDSPVSNHYKPAPLEYLISMFGKMNPVYGGRPKQHIMPLLNAANSDYYFMAQHAYKNCGLVYTTHEIAGKRKIKARLTANGLALLDHWAVCFPAFRKYVKAYVSKKAREEIIGNSFDFQMGVLPASIQKMKDRHDAILKEQAETQAKAAAIAAKQAVWQQKKHAKSIAKTNALQTQFSLQQQYNNILVGNAVTYDAATNSIGYYDTQSTTNGTSTTLLGSLGSTIKGAFSK